MVFFEFLFQCLDGLMGKHQFRIDSDGIDNVPSVFCTIFFQFLPLVRQVFIKGFFTVVVQPFFGEMVLVQKNDIEFIVKVIGTSVLLFNTCDNLIRLFFQEFLTGHDYKLNT